MPPLSAIPLIKIPLSFYLTLHTSGLALATLSYYPQSHQWALYSVGVVVQVRKASVRVILFGSYRGVVGIVGKV